MYTFKVTFHIAELNQEMIGSLNFSDYYINESCIYSIKDFHGKYVGVDNNGKLNANRINVDLPERFKIRKNTDGSYSFLSLFNSKYISFPERNRANQHLVTTKIENPNQMEKFNIISNFDGTVSFKLFEYPNYVTSYKDYLISNVELIQDSEKFRISKLQIKKDTIGDLSYSDLVINPKSVYGIKSFYNNLYVSATNNGNSPLKSSSREIGMCEKFQIEKYGNGTYSLKALCNGKYVCAEEAGKSPLIASRKTSDDWNYEWTRFYIFLNVDGTVSFRAMANDLYICGEGNSWHPIVANRSWIGVFEKFNLYKVSD
jgi:hypothetical protein